MKNLNFHEKFKLNGNSFSSVEEILLFSKKFSMSVHQFLQDWFSDDDSIQIQTSGSTGKPKLISIRKEFMVNSAKATGAFFSLSEETTALLCLSTHYIAGKMMLVRALVLGWELDAIEPVSHPLKNNQKVYDFVAMIPMQVYNSLDNLYNVKKLIVGGGVVSEELQEKLQDIDTQVFATYGMTETVTHIAVKRLNNFLLTGSQSKQSFEMNKAKIATSQTLRNDNGYLSLRGGTTRQSLYKILPNITISKDSRNCLVIDAPKITSEKIVTNDVVNLISKTAFEWLGRYDTIINSGGIKLHPEQIEQKLSKIIMQRFFVAGIPDTVLGEKLVLLVELENWNVETFKSLKVEKFKSSIQNNLKNLNTLTKYEIPKEIYFVDKFIETETGKIQRTKTLSKILS